MSSNRLACLASVLAIGCALSSFSGCGDTPAQAADPPEQAAEWPLEIDSDGSRIVLYQPQPDSLKDDEMAARAAVSIQKPGATEPVFGAVWLEARVTTDRDARTVTLIDLVVPKVTFPGATPQEQGEFSTLLQNELPRLRHTFSLDELVVSLDQSDDGPNATDGIETKAPRIVFAKTPTVLVTIDGQPQLQQVDGSDLMRVVNTPFVILFDPTGRMFHLKGDATWFQAAAIEGPWQAEPTPPASVTAALPTAQFDQSVAGPLPHGNEQILVATEPTELLVSEGEPTWTPTAGNELVYLANSDNDVFMELATKQYFVLLSGRWYRSPSLEQGPWTWVASDALPTAFAQIPPGSKRDNVRAFVAGTDEARDAVLDASVPQTTAISRHDDRCSVTWDGTPRFSAIEGTRLAYGVNTPDSVLQLDQTYYCCQGGVWCSSATPTGPWTVCATVPADVYTIPPSCPLYPVTYVHVYDSTPDVVYVGYLPGYTGCYVFGPTIVYGTGWWYHGWYGSAYFPRPCTWGFAAHYDPWACDWNFGPGFGWGVSPGWFGIGFGWGGPGWWGPGGFHCNHFDIHGHTIAFHPKHAFEDSRHFHVNAIQTHVGHRDIYRRPEFSARNAEPRAAAPPTARTWTRSTRPNDLFVDREGLVERRSAQGAWEARRADGWRPSEPEGAARPTPSPAPSRPPLSSPVPSRSPSPSPSPSRSPLPPPSPTPSPSPSPVPSRPSAPRTARPVSPPMTPAPAPARARPAAGADADALRTARECRARVSVSSAGQFPRLGLPPADASVRPPILPVAIAAVLAASGYAGWRWIGHRPEGAAYRTAPVVRKDIVSAISATGTVVPEDVVDVGAQVNGLVASFGTDSDGKPVDYRSTITEGSVLARIDDTLYAADEAGAQAQLSQARAQIQVNQANVAQAQAKLEQADKDWARAQKLGPSRSLSEVDYDAAQSAFGQAQAGLAQTQASVALAQAQADSAQAALQRAQQNLVYCTIKSPVNGVIIDRRVEIGQTVVSSLNAPSLFLIAKDLSRMQVLVQVNEADVGHVVPGDPVTFTADAFPGDAFTGQVRKIRLNATMTQNVVTYTVEIVTDNSSLRLLPYLTANVRFVVDHREQVLAVPSAALRWSPPSAATTNADSASASTSESALVSASSGSEPAAGGTTTARSSELWLLGPQGLREVQVHAGVSDGSMTEIDGDGIQEGDRVVVGDATPGQPAAAAASPFTPQLAGGRAR